MDPVVTAAFQLATAPAQPQSQGIPVKLDFRLVNVVTVNFFFRPPDPGVGHAY
jgi:hypothetical protein